MAEEWNDVAANDNLAGFTGHIKDKATGLNYMQARYYDPIAGRFLSVDPVSFLQTGNPGMFNRYAYTENDPINFTDPTGMLRCEGDDRCAGVHEDAKNAQSDISSALEGLSDLQENGSDSQYASAFESKFGEGSASNGKTIRSVTKQLKKLSKRIGSEGSGAKVKFGGDAGGDFASGRFNTITLFDSYFSSDARQSEGVSRSGLLTHEAGHLGVPPGKFDVIIDAPTNIGVTRDGVQRAYGRSGANWIAKNQPHRATRNNDNFTCLVTPTGCGN